VVYFVGRRLISALSVVLATLIATFALFFVAPTDPAAAICGERNCTQERYNEIKQNLHLDRPKVQQFAEYTAGIFAGRTFETSGVVQECNAPCLGYSFKNDRPVTEMLKSRLPVTISLVAGYAVLVLTIGVFVGSMAAKRRGTMGDRALMGSTLVMSSVPYYIVALMISLYLTILYPILPRGGYTPLSEDPAKWFVGLLTPWLVLGVYNCTQYARYSRGSMVETLNEDYIRTARAKGLRERTVVVKHGMRASLTPILTIFGLDVGLLLGGAVLTESTFSLPGLGQLVVDAVFGNDLPIVLGVVMVASLFVILANLIVDILYAALDPRVRL
jgi:peptide/nickel transport system permease protein